MFTDTNLFYLAASIYVISAVLVFCKMRKAAFVMLGLALSINGASFILRIYQAWPLLCLYHEPFLLPLGMALIASVLVILGQAEIAGKIIPLIAIFTIIPVFFPKDFFLPFLKSNSIFSHMFSYLSVAARACFLSAAILAAAYLWNLRGKADSGNQVVLRNDFTHLLILGYALHTLALFSAGMWSYAGWGTPVVWEEAMVLSMAATWFIYSCFVHLHLSGLWPVNRRAVFAVCSAVVVVLINYLPELGGFRLPG